MVKQILRFSTVSMFLLGLVFFCPSVFAQGHQEGHNGGNNGSTVNRGAWGHANNYGHGNRHYYHNGNWNRNGWFGWGAPAPVFSDGVLVGSLPPGYTTVVVSGNTYFYGENTYFRQVSTGGFAVVTIPLTN